jgi:4-amino-4-deoxy-L-arabinose transferase-like glycosyltransferase
VSRSRIVLGAILVLAAALRLVGSRYGLPLSVLNPDESSIVPRAWRMGHGHLDPGWYDYPSLLMALLAPVQAFFGAPALGAARGVAVAVGLGGVGATWWLGRRAYGTRAAIVGAAGVAVATTHVAYSRMAVTDVLLTLAVTCVLALAVEGRIEWAGLAVGLAASAKYPGVIAAVPLVVAGWGKWRKLGRASVLAVAGFALTSPFVLINAGSAWDDISRVQRLARAGWLGFENDPITPVAYVDRLWEALGLFLLVAAAGLVAALVRRTRTDLVLLSFVGVYWLTLMPQEAHFDRYVLPLVPVLAVLAGSMTFRAAFPLALAALTLPLAWSVADARELTRTDTRLRADAWVSTNIPREDTIVADPSTLPLYGRRVIRLELPGPGRPFDPERELARLRREGVKWVIISGAVTDRVLAAPDRYPRESLFYEQLGHDLRASFSVSPDDPGLAGPWVRIYPL